MFLFQRLLSSTKPIPNSFEAISSACPRSCEISSVIMERLKRLFGAEKKEACPFPYEASEIAAAPPRWVRNLRRDGDSGMRHSPPRPDLNYFRMVSLLPRTPVREVFKTRERQGNHFLP